MFSFVRSNTIVFCLRALVRCIDVRPLLEQERNDVGAAAVAARLVQRRVLLMVAALYVGLGRDELLAQPQGVHRIVQH